MSIWDFAARGPGADPEASTYALILSDALLYGVKALPPVLARLVNNSVYGVALIQDRNVRGLQPTILASVDLARGINRASLAMGIPSIADLLGALIGEEAAWLSRVRVRGVPPLEQQLGPGDPVTAALNGTVGAGVRWGNNFGFLTAGHVAPMNSIPSCGGQQVGSVVYSNNPIGHGLNAEDDVAVIELRSPSTFHQNISGVKKAGAGAMVNIQGAISSSPAMIQGYATFFHSPQPNATYGELYMTYGQVTSPGDSGAAVLDGSELIGHVVGGSPGTFSYIQDFSYQLKMINNQPGFSGITLW